MFAAEESGSSTPQLGSARYATALQGERSSYQLHKSGTPTSSYRLHKGYTNGTPFKLAVILSNYQYDFNLNYYNIKR